MASSAIKIASHLKELRFHLCQKSAASKGLRDYIEQNYLAMKKANPTFPFLVRECSNVQPKVYARYGMNEKFEDKTLIHYKSEALPKSKDTANFELSDLRKQLSPGQLTLKCSKQEFGKESSLPLSNMSRDQVARAVESLITKRAS